MTPLTIYWGSNNESLNSVLRELIALHEALHLSTKLDDSSTPSAPDIHLVSLKNRTLHEADFFIFDQSFRQNDLSHGELGVYKKSAPEIFTRISEPIKPKLGPRQQAIELIAAYKEKIPTKPPLISIVIPSYNYGKYIRQTIESVINQIENNIEIIVVDNASSDNTEHILSKYKNNYRISIIRNETNIGGIKNFINGFNLARGEYICFLCADDFFSDGYIRNVIKHINAFKPDATFSPIALVDEEGRHIKNQRHPGYPERSGKTNRNELLTLLTKDNYCTPSASFWKRSLLTKIGFFDIRFHGAADWDLAVRVAQAGGGFVFIESPSVNYRIHSAQDTWRWGKGLEPLEDHCLLLEKVLRNGVPKILEGHEAPIAALLKSRRAACQLTPEILENRINFIIETLEQSALPLTSSLANNKDGGARPPFFTVIVTTYNRPRLLIDALLSVENQKFRDFDVILVNDCGEPVEHLLNQFSSVINMIHHGKNRGLSAARNSGLAAARGKHIVYLDDDDLMLPEHLAVLADEIKLHPETIVYTDADYVTETIESNRRIEHNRCNPHRHGKFSNDQLMVSNFIPVNTFCHPRLIIDKIGNFDETLTCFEDWDFLLRLAKTQPLFHIEKTTVEVRNHATSGESHMLSRNLKNFPALYRRIYSKHPSDNPITGKRRLQLLSSLEENNQLLPLDKSYPDYFERAYANLFDRRSKISAEINLTPEMEDNGSPEATSMHFLMLLESGAENKLADTLDSLNQQIYANWHLDIVTTSPSPEGISEIPCLGWHTPNSPDEIKVTFDFIVQARRRDWIIEIPAGVKIDPLFLWRIAQEIGSNTTARTYFVDDDCFNSTSEHFNPRFKPGVNPEALQSTDLAGPICVPRDIWLATGGASHRFGSPWFSKLLNVAAQFGWGAIKHIPDILFSYPDKFPSNIESCLIGLSENIKAHNIGSEIVPVSTSSWTIRYPLASVPLVSIAILSTGQFDLLSRCLSSVIEKTDYPNFEIIIALTKTYGAPDLDTWLAHLERSDRPSIRIIDTEIGGNYATRCNAAAMASSSDFLLFLKEETVVIQEKWLDELVRCGAQLGVGGVSPRMIQPGSAIIENSGCVLGLNGIVGSPYQGKTKLGEELGYLDCIHVARDVSTLPAACMLIRKESYLNAGGMDEADLGNNLAETDLCLKIRRAGERLIYQPLSNIVSSDPKEAVFDIDPTHAAEEMLSETRAKQVFFERWYPEAAADPFWSPALSLATRAPVPEIDFHARWQLVPSDLPRILAHALPNGQGDYRVTSPLKAIANAGLASDCIWRQRISGEARFNTLSELLRLSPDSVIVQHYTITPALAALQEWDSSGCRPFTVYALDDLITDMDVTNPFRKDIPANARARLQYALQRCDRMVVSTDYLAEAYRGFIPDILVVPNRLEQASWLHLRSLRRTSKKPRIGWAGGTTHQGDLLLLKGIIEQTRDEADWIFFGMCPDEIRPLLAEFHPLVKFSEFPGYLASLNLDLAVAPLTETPFNRGKSNLRLLDYGVLGIPVVCTDIEPYRNSPACRVNNSVAEWTEAIRARIHDADAREHEGNAMRRWVLDGYLLENHLEEWLSAHLPG